jgi:hypothetical protein
MLLGRTAGVIGVLPDTGPLRLSLRIGGGFKGYMFDLTWGGRPMASDPRRRDRISGCRYRSDRGQRRNSLSRSSFDQSKLPIRGITPQNQQQNDLFFTVGIAIRP